MKLDAASALACVVSRCRAFEVASAVAVRSLLEKDRNFHSERSEQRVREDGKRASGWRDGRLGTKQRGMLRAKGSPQHNGKTAPLN